jgi:kynurenine formamidase
MTRRLIDLSHPIYDGLVTYPGLPAPVFGEHLSREASREKYAPGTEFSIGLITMVGNTGTYMDSPFHRFADGTDLAGLTLEQMVDLPGLLVHVAPDAPRGIDVAAFGGLNVLRRAVLIHTGWDRNWATEAYGTGHPWVTAAAIDWLVENGAALVGIDSLNIDDTADGSRPAHTKLLAAGIPLVEHLTGLEQLPDDGFRFTAVPAPVQGFGTFPVRAYATLEDSQPD